MQRLKGLFVLSPPAADLIYAEPEHQAIAELIDIDHKIYTADEVISSGIGKECDVIFSGWGGPRLDTKFLAATPKLKALLYGAGSVSGIITEAAWQRGVQISTAFAANAKPVAEYTLAMILLCMKDVFRLSAGIRQKKAYPSGYKVVGNFGSTLGLISLSTIGRMVVEMLEPFDLNIIAYDPFVTPEEAAKLGVKLVSLEEIFIASDVVSLHTPLLKETEGMITGAHLASMKPRASFINTARGAVVRELEMIEELKRRPDLFAVLDVTAPEPPVTTSPLYTLPNVILTPHVAGSHSAECRRMGQEMIGELKRLLGNEPLKWAVTKESSKFTSHRPAGA